MHRLLPVLILLAAPVAIADVPALLVPPHRDSVSTSSAPAPLLVPGRGAAQDTTAQVRTRLAREQYAMGRALERERNPAAAIAAYRNAVNLDPAVLDAHFRMGLLFGAVAQHRAAANEFQAELSRHPDRSDADRMLALAQAQMGDTLAAIARLERIVAAAPRDEPSWQALGFARALAGRTADAERALRHALELDARDADAWRDLGVLLASTGRIDEARTAYRRAAELDRKDATALLDLGNLERRDHHAKEALAAYRDAAARDTSSSLALQGQVEVLIEMGRRKEAGEVYRRRLALAPNDIQLRREAMHHYSELGRRDVALELARDGVLLEPRSADAHMSLGMAYESNGDFRGALAELRAAESLVKPAATKARIRAMIARLRSRSPDSLRGVFEADRAAHPEPPGSLGAPDSIR